MTPYDVKDAINTHFITDTPIRPLALSDILYAVKKYPTLTSHGFWLPCSSSVPHKEHRDRRVASRDVLLNSLNQFTLCCQWLRKCYKVKSFTKESYALKHDVERYYDTYIANGVFIAAAIHEGFSFRRQPVGSLNADIAIGVPKEIIISRNDSRYLPGGKEIKPPGEFALVAKREHEEIS